MLLWVLIVLGAVVIVGRAVFGHKVGLALIGLWIVVGLLGWITGIGIRE